MALKKLTPDQLSASLGPKFFELQSLISRFNENERPRNKELLDRILKNSRRPITEWEPQVVSQFLRMGVKLTRAEWISAPRPKERTGMCTVLEWWCSLAAAFPSTDQLGATAARLLALARLLEQCPAPQLLEVETLVTQDAIPFGFNLSVTAMAIRMEWLLLVHQHSDNPDNATGSETTVARQVCIELFDQDFAREELREIALRLAIPLPERPTETISLQPEKDPVVRQPTLWQLPDGNGDLLTELQSCLFDLLRLIDERDSPLSPRTGAQIRAMQPNLESDNLEAGIFYSAMDLWRAFVRHGDTAALTLAQRLLHFLCCAANLASTIIKRRANVHYWWMNTHLPLLLKTSDLKSILQDAETFYTAAKIPRGDLTLWEGVVEAFAGECRRMEKSAETQERQELVDDHWDGLLQIHNQYQQRVGTKANPEETEAWDYIRSFGRQELQATQTGVQMKTYAEHPDLKVALQGGAHGSVKAFIEKHLDEIKELLGRRLQVRLAPEFVREPDGDVFQREAEKRRQVDPSFAASKQAMKRNDFAQASQILERLLPHLQGRPEAICRNHLAFAQARQGHLLEARTHLATLTQFDFKEPSLYWNLACCIPADHDQTAQRIEVLLQGLQKAPHPIILHALVYLGLLLDDTRVREWLKSLPLVEALLVSFFHDYESLDFKDRDRALVRLNAYLRRGEPLEPDPTTGSLYGVEAKRYRESVNKYLDTLLELHQPQVFEFWLNCREVFAVYRYEYWECKVDFLKRTGRMDEAAKAFADEVRLRVGFMQHATRQVFPPFLRETRERAREWLLQCMVPELKGIGHRVYQSLKNQEKSAEHLKGQLLPNDRRIQAFYSETKQASPILPPTPKAGNASLDNISSGTIGTEVAGLLATISAECQTGLHDISHVRTFEPRLDQLRSLLAVGGFPRSASAMGELLQTWLHRNDSSSAIPETLLRAAQAAVSRLRLEIESELPPDMQVITGQLIRSFERVNHHFARDSQLLPKLVVESISGESVVIPSGMSASAFPIRVRADADSKSTRLLGAIATLDDELTSFPLRDKLADIETIVSPNQHAILTFEFSSIIDFSQTRNVRIQITYEFAGRSYTAKPSVILLTEQTCPILPEFSPYIFSRPLEAEEIESHFFGRSEEQRAILDSIRDGQQRLRYVEGIRRAGKSSLLHSVEYEATRRHLPLVPVYVSAASVAATDDAGQILFGFLDAVARAPLLRTISIVVPSGDKCRRNLKLAYQEFLAEIEMKLPTQRVVILLDDFQVVVETGLAARETSPSLFQGIIGLLNLIFEHANPRARLLWVFAGQRAFNQFKSMLPGALLWGTLRVLPIDFLNLIAVGEILRQPLNGTNVSILDATVERVHRHTGGHPEVVQQVAEQMLDGARKEHRWILTPADADQAASDVADYSDNFAATWYPVAELTAEQKQLVAAFLNAVTKTGASIEPFKLIAGGDASEPARKAISDLISRKIFDSNSDGTIRLKAYVLERWLRRFARTEFDGNPGFGVHGCVAIFIDVANLTAGKGSCWLDGLQTTKGEDGVPGRFSLATVLTAIETWSTSVSPAPIVARWVINYPLKSPAVVECNAKGYQVENIPQELFSKGDGGDDVTLREKIAEVEQWYGTANHFVIVTGDKDYCLTADRLLKNGRFVHFVYRAGTLSANVNSRYQVLARQYPNRFTLADLETLLEKRVS